MSTEDVYDLPQSIGPLVSALAKAQAQMHAPPRNRSVTVKTQSGSNYTFAYATLDAIIEGIRKPLTDNGLWFTQSLGEREGRTVLETMLWHDSGQSIGSVLPIASPLGIKAQEFGSALTYMRRYALTALLGIAADEDDDGNAADGNTATATPRTATKPRTAPKVDPGASSGATEAIPPPAPHPTPAKGALSQGLKQFVESGKIDRVALSWAADGVKARNQWAEQFLGPGVEWSRLDESQCRSLLAKMVEYFSSGVTA